MKNLIAFFIYFITIITQAQSTNEIKSHTPRRGLSQNELAHAVDLYVKLTKTDAYLERSQKMEVLNRNIRGLELPQAEVNFDWKKYFAENLDKTKFRTAEEASTLMERNIELTFQIVKENEEVYSLMKRATREQLGQILQPERRHL